MNTDQSDLSETFLYRWRYWIGYGLVALGLIAALVFAGLYLPGGISNQEMQSVVKSSSVNIVDFLTIGIVNLPYHLLQHVSIALLGVTIFSIKLPSIILAFISAIGLVLLLRSWFKPNIAVLASLIAITTGQFLFIAQNGTPDIMFLLWSVLLMLLAGIIPTLKKYKQISIMVLFIIIALSLYTPLSIYVILAFAAAILLHPHLRYQVKQLTKKELAIGISTGLLLISPLIYAIIKTPSTLLTLLGIPTHWPNLINNLGSLGSQYFGFMNPGGTTIITPVFELGSMLLIAIGIYNVVKTRATAKSYAIAIWSLCLLPFVVLNPDYTIITFLPLVLLLASGLNELLSYWYSLFPRNPYARVAGLVPIVILVSVLVLSGINRYIYEYRYNPNLVPNFSNDLRLIPEDTKHIVVANSEHAFYNVVAKYDKKIAISVVPVGDSFLATHAAKRTFSGYTIDKIITSANSNDSDRFYLYTR